VDFRSLFFVCIVLRSKSYISLLLTEPIFWYFFEHKAGNSVASCLLLYHLDVFNDN
jgi:hypothetical protein